MELIRDMDLVDQYQTLLKANFTSSAKELTRTIVAANLTVRRVIHWDEENHVWGHFGKGGGNRFWNPFGVDDARVKERVVNSVQINPSRLGHMNTGGAFLSDPASESVFLAHSGRLGGRSSGQGTSFLTQFETITVNIGESKKPYTIIGEINDASLNARIADFVAAAAAFKSSKAKKANTKKAKSNPEKPGNDEYAGTLAYRRKGYVETVRLHGRVFKALKDALRLRGVTASRDVYRDLFYTKNGRQVLFEIKTSTTPQHIYTAVGQLMMHGIAKTQSASCFVVLPAIPGTHAKKLRTLGIGVISYRETSKGLVFNVLVEACDP
jgi:hypothetical protein